VTLKRAGRDVWQLECHASNVTASVQNDHLLHGYMLPVFFAIISCIVHNSVLKFSPCLNIRFPRLVRIADWYSIHVLLQHDPDAVIYLAEVRTVGWPHVRTDELECLMAQKLDCVTSTMCWHIVLLERNTTPAMLRIAGSSFCISNKSW